MQTNKLKQLDKILIKYYTGRGLIKNCSSRRIVQREYREHFERAKPFPGKKTSQDILLFKPCWVGFTYCRIVNVISRSCRAKNTAYLYMVSKHFFFELRWLDWIFLGGYLPSLSINYVAMSKDMEKRFPQLYYIKMKNSYDLGFIAIGVAMAT